jgi:hypothetical protein
MVHRLKVEPVILAFTYIALNGSVSLAVSCLNEQGM